MAHKKIISLFLFGSLLSSASMTFGAVVESGSMVCKNVYVGIFGGWARKNSNDFNQFGTALFTEAEGGPLAVNTLSSSNSDSTGILGAHFGFVWPNVMYGLPVTPAIEFEAYYMHGIEIEGHAINNTDRLPEHDFLLTYPLRSRVFLVNAILNINGLLCEAFTPYIGIGIGSTLGSIFNASSTQLSPPEAGINHYNSSPNSKTTSFAGQAKAGIGYNLNSLFRVFAEYRYLYLATTEYTLGSTVYAVHAPTTFWRVRMEPQHYNMGTVGIELYF